MQEKVYKTRITDLKLSTARLTTWRSLAYSVLSRCLQFVQISDAYLYIFSCNTPTRCNQLDSNLANLGATVEVEKIL